MAGMETTIKYYICYRQTKGCSQRGLEQEISGKLFQLEDAKRRIVEYASTDRSYKWNLCEYFIAEVVEREVYGAGLKFREKHTDIRILTDYNPRK